MSNIHKIIYDYFDEADPYISKIDEYMDILAEAVVKIESDDIIQDEELHDELREIIDRLRREMQERCFQVYITTCFRKGEKHESG